MREKKKKFTSGSSAASGGVDFQEVERVLDFMEKHGLEEFEYERSGVRIRLKKPSTNSAYRSSAPEIVVANPVAPAAQSSSPPREGVAEAARGEDLHVIKSPIVGTFYGSPSPGTAAFVRVGDRVEGGQVLCIIEAMKLMNEIESDVAGEVMRIFVEDGQPVEYGEPLFAIHPTRKK